MRVTLDGFHRGGYFCQKLPGQGGMAARTTAWPLELRLAPQGEATESLLYPTLNFLSNSLYRGAPFKERDLAAVDGIKPPLNHGFPICFGFGLGVVGPQA